MKSMKQSLESLEGIIESYKDRAEQELVVDDGALVANREIVLADVGAPIANPKP